MVAERPSTFSEQRWSSMRLLCDLVSMSKKSSSCMARGFVGGFICATVEVEFSLMGSCLAAAAAAAAARLPSGVSCKWGIEYTLESYVSLLEAADCLGR